MSMVRKPSVPGAAHFGKMGSFSSRRKFSGASHGGYTPANSLIKGKSRGVSYGSQNALFGSTADGIIIRHSEFVADVISGNTAPSFTYNTYLCNPGNVGSFPWLQAVAQAYQEYEFLGLVYEYRTMSSDALNSTNTALGQVIMGFEYNVNQKLPTTKQEIEQLMGSISVKPSSNARMAVDCRRKSNVIPTLYIRNNSALQDDARFENLGYLVIATNGFQGSLVNCGELWCHYVVRLRKPIIPNTGFSAYAHYAGAGGSAQLNVSGGAPLGTTTNPDGVFGPTNVDAGFCQFQDTIGGTWTNTSGGVSGVVQTYSFPDKWAGCTGFMFLGYNDNAGQAWIGPSVMGSCSFPNCLVSSGSTIGAIFNQLNFNRFGNTVSGSQFNDTALLTRFYIPSRASIGGPANFTVNTDGTLPGNPNFDLYILLFGPNTITF